MRALSLTQGKFKQNQASIAACLLALLVTSAPILGFAGTKDGGGAARASFAAPSLKS
jgi:hypothetical protein